MIFFIRVLGRIVWKMKPSYDAEYKLLRQDIQKYKSLFPHVSAAIQSRQNPLKGDTIQYIYTDSKHSNPLCRVIPIEDLACLPLYDKEKYKEMVLDAAETVLGFFGFDRMAYSNLRMTCCCYMFPVMESRI